MRTLADEKRDREFRELLRKIPEHLGDLPGVFLTGTAALAIFFAVAALILYRML
jgi:hypothetical protein